MVKKKSNNQYINKKKQKLDISNGVFDKFGSYNFNNYIY